MDKKVLWLVLGIIPLLSACAIGHTQVMKAPETRLGSFQVLEVPDLMVRVSLHRERSDHSIVNTNISPS